MHAAKLLCTYLASAALQLTRAATCPSSAVLCLLVPGSAVLLELLAVLAALGSCAGRCPVASVSQPSRASLLSALQGLQRAGLQSQLQMPAAFAGCKAYAASAVAAAVRCGSSWSGAMWLHKAAIREGATAPLSGCTAGHTCSHSIASLRGFAEYTP